MSDYGPNILTGGTPTAATIVEGSAANAVDGNVATYVNLYNAANNNYWQYQLASTKTVAKIRLHPSNTPISGASYGIKDFTLKGSNNGSDWDTLVTGQHTNAAQWEEWEFENDTAYLYYKLDDLTNWYTGLNTQFLMGEVEMMELEESSAPEESSALEESSAPSEESSVPEESSAPEESSFAEGGMVDRQINTSTDDVWVLYDTGVPEWVLESALELEIGMVVNSKSGMGLRFNNIPIHNGATITSAYITFRAKASGSGTTVNAVIIGQKAANPSTFSTIADYQSRRGTVVGGANDDNITEESISWLNIEAWVEDSYYQTPDISSIIQEIIDLPAWNKNNSLVLFADDHAGNSTAGRDRVADSFDDGYGPILHIEWEFESSGEIESSTLEESSAPSEESSVEESSALEESSFESSMESSGGPEEKIKFIFGEMDLVYENKKFLHTQIDAVDESRKFLFADMDLTYQNTKFMQVVIRLVDRLTKPTAGSIFSRTSAVTKEVT